MKTKEIIVALALSFVLALGMSAALAPSEAEAATGQASNTETLIVDGTYHYTSAYMLWTELFTYDQKLIQSAPAWDSKLANAAMQRAAELSICYNTLGKRPDANSSYTVLPGRFQGETVAITSADDKNAYQTAFKNMLSNKSFASTITSKAYKSVGIGCFVKGKWLYWVALFSTASGDITHTAVDEYKKVNITLDYGLCGKNQGFNLDEKLGSKISIKVGDSKQLNYDIANTGASGKYCRILAKNAKWTSSNPTVATVDASGLVKAKSKGTTTIKATLPSGKSLSIKVEATQVTHNVGQTDYSGSNSNNNNNNTDNGDITVSGNGDQSVIKGWKTVGSNKYYYNSKGKKQTGWLKLSGKTYYLDKKTGAMKTGWQTISSKRYYFDKKTGVMKTGWQTINAKKYYLDTKSGAMASGWKQLNKKWYFFTKGTGALKTGVFADGKTLYASNSSGVMYAGKWVKIRNQWYKATASGALKTGWFQEGKSWYYCDTRTGAMKTGKAKIGKDTYYFTSKGVMKTGWQKISKQWYLFKSSGAMATGWQKSGNAWYYFNKSTGAMKTGWLTSGKQKYYFASSGAMKTGWQKIGKNYYYFNTSGAMVKSKWVGDYYLQKDGTMATNKWIGKYHVNKNGKWDKTKK